MEKAKGEWWYHWGCTVNEWQYVAAAAAAVGQTVDHYLQYTRLLYSLFGYGSALYGSSHVPLLGKDEKNATTTQSTESSSSSAVSTRRPAPAAASISFFFGLKGFWNKTGVSRLFQRNAHVLRARRNQKLTHRNVSDNVVRMELSYIDHI